MKTHLVYTLPGPNDRLRLLTACHRYTYPHAGTGGYYPPVSTKYEDVDCGNCAKANVFVERAQKAKAKANG